MDRVVWLRRLGVVLVLLASAAPAAGQSSDSAAAGGPAPGIAPRPRVLTSVAQGLAVNVAVNRFDAWVLGEGWARVGLSSWKSNLRLGWEWDENAFGTNMFAHPYHGGLYFNAGRAKGLDYWQSAPLAFLGSWMWEYFGETHRPSLNDFFMTSFGGIALGEVFHRVAATIRDNGTSGRTRLLRELGAAALDPIGASNRLARGDWSRVGPNPPEHRPRQLVFRFNAGARRVREEDGPETLYSPTMVVDVSYGDRFGPITNTPYDVFDLRGQISPAGGGLNQLRSAGRLFGMGITRAEARHRHLFEVRQRFDYVNNPVYQFGAQSVEAGILSRWWAGKTVRLRSRFAVDGMFLGAIDAPFSGIGERTYDFGPGLGATVELAVERRGVTYLAWYNRVEYLHTVSGAQANHAILFSGLEATLPVGRGLGLGFHLSGDDRSSTYAVFPDDRRRFLEARVFLSWTDVNRPPPRAPQ